MPHIPPLNTPLIRLIWFSIAGMKGENKDKIFELFVRIRFRLRVKYPNGPGSGSTHNDPVPARSP